MGLLDPYPRAQKKALFTLETGMAGLGGAAVGELVSTRLAPNDAFAHCHVNYAVAHQRLDRLLPFCSTQLAMHLPAVASTAAGPIGAPILGASLASILKVAASGKKLPGAAWRKLPWRRKNSDAPLETTPALEFAANREKALCLNRKALEMQLELDERARHAYDRKGALIAARKALASAELWASQENDGLQTEVSSLLASPESAASWQAVVEATERVRRLEEVVRSDEQLMFEMKAKVDSIEAQAAEARVYARSAQSGYFVTCGSDPEAEMDELVSDDQAEEGEDEGGKA